MLDLLNKASGHGLLRSNEQDQRYIRRNNKSNPFELGVMTFKNRKVVVFELRAGIMGVLRRLDGRVEFITQTSPENALTVITGTLKSRLEHIGAYLKEHERVLVNLCPENRHFKIGTIGSIGYLKKQDRKTTDAYDIQILQTASRSADANFTLNDLKARTTLHDEWFPDFKEYYSLDTFKRRYSAMNPYTGWALYQMNDTDDVFDIEQPTLKYIRIK